MWTGPENEQAFDRWVKEALQSQFALADRGKLPDTLTRLLDLRLPECDQNKP